MIKELQIRVSPQVAAAESAIREFIAREQAIDARTICHVRVLKRSIDARQRNIVVNLTVRVYVNEMPADEPFTVTHYGDVSECPAVVVVGAGPGGLFAALRLIELHLRPIVIERGKDVRERKKDLAAITRTQQVDPESNYCFGEGGAGAYSDGKLYTRSKKRGSVDKILNVFCQHGASTAILTDAHPHIGTDKLPRVIENMRNTILRCGGEVHFQTKMTALALSGDEVVGVETIHMPTGQTRSFRGPVILATGHSARDVYQYLAANEVEIEAKGIDGRGVYSFCMCPGGFVIPAATAPQQVVVNGMSPSQRNTQWSNSGMVVELRTDDVEGDDPLRMMRWQQRLEQECWQQANRKQTAPAQRMADFVKGRLSYDLPKSSYAPGLISSPLHFWLPEGIGSRLRQGFEKFGQMRRGFLTNEAVLIGVETRTSAPVRILRCGDTLQHVRLRGLFPCGEGAGYAGGIVSAGVDGERCADSCAEMLGK